MQAVVVKVETGRVERFRGMHAFQPAVDRERPAMIVADELPRVSGVGKTYLVATVRATVQKALYAAVFLANDDYVVLPHIGGDIVACLGNLRFVSNKQPAAR